VVGALALDTARRRDPWTPRRVSSIVRRLSFGVAAFVLADLILGMAVFSVAVLGIFAFFSFEWLNLVAEFSQHGLVFGTVAQVQAAWGLLVLSLAMIPLVVYLGIQSLRVPRAVWTRASRSSVAGATHDATLPI
jgi:hypothetical protein